MSGAEALWGRESMAGIGNDPLMNNGGQRLDTEVGYGLPIGSQFVGTPRAGMRTCPSTATTTGSGTGCRYSSKGS